MSSENELARLHELDITPAATLDDTNVHKDPETGGWSYDNQAAVKIIIDDTGLADNYININQWASGWTLCDMLYQSPQAASAFDGGNVAQANVPKFILSNHISSIVPKVMGGLFYEDPPFLLRPRPNTDPDVVRAKTALFSSQLDDMKFQEEAERALDQMALFGTCIMKWGYCETKRKQKRYKRKAEPQVMQAPGSTSPDLIDTPGSDEIELEYYDKVISRPWIRYCDIRTVLVDPGCRYGDIRRAKWVIYRDYATYDDLAKLRQQPGYNIPDDALLKAIFLSNPHSGPENISLTIPEGMMGYLQHALPANRKTSADPMQAPIEILERWDNDKVMVMLSFNGHNILIRNEANPYSKIPFLSANWRNIQDSFYGQGLGLLIGSEQLVDQGVTNLALDLLAYGLQPTAVRKKGFNAPTQQVRWKQGGIIDVDEDVDKAFRFLEMPPVPSEAWNFIQQATSDAATTSGANEQVVQGAGSPGVRTTGMRSGTGAAAVVQANASRLDGPTGRFVRQIFEPWLYEMDDLNNQMLPSSVLRDTLGEELGNAFKIDHLKFRNAQIEYEVLAGAKLGAKASMAQALPFILQLLNNPTFVANIEDGGDMFDAKAIFNSIVDMAGWKFRQNFIRPMTDQEKQSHAANKPAALQARQMQAQQQMQLQKFQQEEQLEDQKQMGKAGAEVLRTATEHALGSELLSGEPGTEGFGSSLGL